MQSSTAHLEIFNSSLGERRGKSDLARFSLDSSWARAVSDSARSRAYPSPPMSGSPPLPPRHNPDSSNRGHGSYGSSGQEVYQGIQTPPLRTYHPEGHSHQGYPPATRMDDTSAQLSYQQRQPPPLAPQMYHQPSHPYPQHHTQAPAPFAAPERAPTGEAPEFSSPKAQRKTKGHVASACVPCKRAHLRCDAQRPCSRCSANGKEDACVDVQHKKRGRPRLRDEREQRLGYESMSGSGSGYPHPSEGGMRRPLSMYASGTAPMNTDFGGPIAPRYLDHASVADVNIPGGLMMPAPRMMAPPEPPCAYLTMKMQIAKATSSFNEIVGLPGGMSKNFQDLVLGNEREKVAQLQRVFEDERRQREPHYLPPISFNADEERTIQSVGFGPEVTGQLRFDHSLAFTVPITAPDGSQRTFQARFGLGKKDATYFIAMVIHLPTPSPAPVTPQPFGQPALSSPYSRDSYSRGSSIQYEYHAPQQAYASTQAPPQFMNNPAYGDPREQMAFRAPAQGLGQVPLGPNVPPSTTMPPFSRPPSRPEYSSHSQIPYQTPRSELPPAQPARQHDLQLPPIRDQRGEPSSADAARRRDDRSNRVDIGGLLENPRGSRG